DSGDPRLPTPSSAAGRVRQVTVGPGLRVSPVPSRLQYRPPAVQADLHQHLLDVIAGCRTEFEWLASDWDRRNALVRLEPVRMAEPKWAVLDHSPIVIGA